MLFKAAFSFPKVTKLFSNFKTEAQGLFETMEQIVFYQLPKRYKMQLFSSLSGNDVIFLQQCRRVI